MAEDTALIVPIGDWVVRTACAQSKAWQDAGLAPVRMSVNLSPRQFQQTDLAKRIVGALRDARLDPQWLQLEITEGTAMRDADFTLEMMRRLRREGVHISIDDFGTGYSSLGYLKRFPIDEVKIDRSFVADLPADTDDAAIVATIIALAENLNLRTVAEGVETEEQLAFLKDHGCREAQGYLFSKPRPPGVIKKMLARREPLTVSTVSRQEVSESA